MPRLLTRFAKEAGHRHAVLREPARSAEERRVIRQALAVEEVREAEHSARLAAQIADAGHAEVQAQERLAMASATRARLEAEQLATSMAAERRVANAQRQLSEGAPPELAVLQRNVALLVDAARTKFETRLARGFEDVSGRRSDLVATNTGDVEALLAEARRVEAMLTAELYAEAPDAERFGPFAEVTIDAARFQRGTRHDASAAWLPDVVIVPARLAELFDAIGGVVSPKPELSPGQLRETLWSAERAARRRWNSGEAWR